MTIKSLPIAVDVMGSDLGPSVIIDGAVEVANKLGLASILVGQEDLINNHLKKCQVSNPSLISVHHSSEVIKMEDSPSKAIRIKDNSVRVAFELVEEGRASATISAGNTGAMHAAGIFTVGTIQGITRPAIATLIPRSNDAFPIVLLDSGANVQCNANQLAQFGIMGKYYAKVLFGLEHPRIGILSNGTEQSKGNDLSRAAAYILSNMPELNYVGYVEGRDIAKDSVDVIVCDGFVGNIVLKTMEGSVELIVDAIKHYVSNSISGKIGMYLAKPIFKKLFKEKLDPSNYGGAPLLGLNGVGIVCHGSSNSRAIFNAIKAADQLYKSQIINQMRNTIANIEDSIDDANYEDGIWGRMGKEFNSKKDKKKEQVD